jgi:hypothetical protein
MAEHQHHGYGRVCVCALTIRQVQLHARLTHFSKFECVGIDLGTDDIGCVGHCVRRSCPSRFLRA